MTVVAERSASISSPPRPIPSAVRISSRVMLELASQRATGRDHRAAEAGLGASGVVFGFVEEDVVSVEAARPFAAGNEEKYEEHHGARHRPNGREADRYPTTGGVLHGGETPPDRHGPSGGESFDEAFERLIAAAKADPELKSLELLGWYRFRHDGDSAPVTEFDVRFHNRRFRRASDIALILSRKPRGGISIDAYTLDAYSSDANASTAPAGPIAFSRRIAADEGALDSDSGSVCAGDRHAACGGAWARVVFGGSKFTVAGSTNSPERRFAATNRALRRGMASEVG